ncbi:MAG TPA: hypothetical protein VNT54_13645, partial [Solirubrobacteraceae bacterium]|nr:hypothetical protein [Solirubrobacteraceae bacterium]
MQIEPLADLLAGHRFAAELREELQLDGGQQRLRRPEPHTDLHDSGGIEVWRQSGYRLSSGSGRGCRGRCASRDGATLAAPRGGCNALTPALSRSNGRGHATADYAAGLDSSTLSNRLAAGREALQRGAWAQARAAFAAIRDEAGPEAHEGLANAAFGAGDLAEAFASQEEAYRQFRARGDARGAGRMASQLAWNYFNLRGEPAVANGWTRRAHRMLDDLPPCAEQGHLAVTEGDAAIFGDDDPQSALGFARDAQRLGGLVGVAELEVLGLALEGLSLVSIGNMREGLSQLDEAAAAVTAGELDDLAAVGVTFCYLIFACEKARDYGRAGQWCERLRDLCERSGRNALLGVCRAHYAGVLTGAGEWQRAEAELERAAELLDRHAPGLAPERVLRLAELRRRQGRAEEAKRLYGEIEFHPHGLIGLAAVALDDDDALAAADL